MSTIHTTLSRVGDWETNVDNSWVTFQRAFSEATAICPRQLQETGTKIPKKKLHHRRPQTVAQISHEILETSPEHGHTRPAGKQDGTKDRRQAGLGDEPRRRTQHPRPDGRQAGGQDQRQEKDKPGGADTASQMKDKLRDKTKTKAGETRRETRERQDRASQPARRTQHPSQDGRQDRRQDRRQEKNKTSQADTASQTRWETRWETRPEASPAKRTQHPSQGGHTKKALRTPTVNCLGEKSHGDPKVGC